MQKMIEENRKHCEKLGNICQKVKARKSTGLIEYVHNSGATQGTRTLDPRITNALLYQLS